jgi:uroporphyrinogen decarboxylase
MVVIGEDMAGRNGPLVSPAVFREFMMPYYQRFTAFCRDHGVVSIWVDSDGDMRKLIPLWIEAGVTGVIPCDVVLGQVDVMALREAFPRLLLAGGIDKRVIEEGRTFEEIDVELERKVRPLVRLGGYFPGPDHAWSPQASLKNFRYYMDRLYDICQVSG